MASRKYLFIDDRWIAHSYAVHRLVEPPGKHALNPLIVADRPWERGINCYGTVLLDDGRFRMWYQVINRTERIDRRFVTAVGYAESDDGLAWTKPLVGVTHPVYGPTNLVVVAGGRSELCSPTVVRDDAERSPARRYKMMFYDAMAAEDLARHGAPFPPSVAVPGWAPVEGEGMFIATSPDGIDWTRSPQPAFGGASDTAAMTIGPKRHFLAAFKRSVRPDRHFRMLAATTSRNGRDWAEPRVILEPDWHDAPGTEFYGMSPLHYSGNWIGLVWMYHNAPDDKSLDVQLATGPDDAPWQEAWTRAADRRTLLGVGRRGDWDAGRVYPATSLVIAPPADPDGIWLYYGGANVRHDDNRFKEHGIGLARLRLDGFACLRADYFPGTVETAPIRIGGRRLRINANARQGYLMVAVVDAQGQIVAQSRPVAGIDGTDIEIEWETGRLPRRNAEVRLIVEMAKTSFYAFWFDD